MPRLMLICCEGRTEREYFKILKERVYRIPGYVRIDIHGEKGQHKALVNRTADMRSELSVKEGVPEDSIECWAVCDDDGMKSSFTKLEEYARSKSVHLAFSRPQFESYLIQHFEQSGETDPAKLYEGIARHMKAAGAGDHYDKSDLEWLERLLIDKPKMINTAITNADQRDRQSSSPYLTVQALVKRMRDMQRY